MRIRGAPNAMPDGPSVSSQPSAFERDALGALDSLYRTARRLSRDRADAEDLVQDTYLKAFRAADRFEPGTNLRAWLFTILHNTARNRFRDRARDTVAINSDVVDRAADAPPPGARGTLSGSVDTPETLLLRDTLAPELQSAIDALPETFREAVWLRDVEEFSYAEIAEMLGVPIGTVMSRISRGRHLLFERLNPARAAALSGKPEESQTMSKCTEIDPLVTPYVDGELPAPERTLVDEHLHRCPPCHSRVSAESAVRDLMRARQPGLTAERASASLHAQCTELANRTGEASAARLRRGVPPASPARAIRAWWDAPWHLRVVPLALTASLVLLVGGAFLYLATQYSARLLAAELCADHMTCFAANNLLGTHEAPAAVESSMLSAFGWRLHLPEQFDASGLELVGARRCLYGEGKVAHLMYRDQGRPVSIYMLPKSVRRAELVEMLGHEVAIWSSGDRTFVLITRGSRDEVARMASFVKGALQ